MLIQWWNNSVRIALLTVPMLLWNIAKKMTLKLVAIVSFRPEIQKSWVTFIDFHGNRFSLKWNFIETDLHRFSLIFQDHDVSLMRTWTVELEELWFSLILIGMKKLVSCVMVLKQLIAGHLPQQRKIRFHAWYQWWRTLKTALKSVLLNSFFFRK